MGVLCITPLGNDFVTRRKSLHDSVIIMNIERPQVVALKPDNPFRSGLGMRFGIICQHGTDIKAEKYLLEKYGYDKTKWLRNSYYVLMFVEEIDVVFLSLIL